MDTPDVLASAPASYYKDRPVGKREVPAPASYYLAVVLNSGGAANSAVQSGLPRAPRYLPEDNLYYSVSGHKQDPTDHL